MRVTWSARNRQWSYLDTLGAIGAAGLLLGRLIPFHRLWFWRCSFRDLTGIPCPGCGLTRVAERASRLDWERAFYANPAGLVAAAGFAVAAAWSALHLSVGLRTPDLELSPRESLVFWWSLGALLAINYGLVIWFHRLGLA